jgi:hypothetical protein
MSPFLKTARDGELFVDHRASPGIPPGQAQQMGLPPTLVGEGRVMHAATLGCPHCGSHIMLNPERKRARANCFKCNAYICDWCAATMDNPDYVHRTFAQIVEMVRSGKWTVSGSPSNPILTPTESSDG